MTSKARVLIVSADKDRSTIWSAIVRELGYDTVAVDPTTALASARLARADCALVEAGFDTKHLMELLRGKESIPAVPLVLLEPSLADRIREESRCTALPNGEDDPLSVMTKHLHERLGAMVRIKVMTDEWRRRHAAYTALGQPPVLPADPAKLIEDRDATILFAGSPSADYPVIESAFADEKTVIVAAFTPLMTADYLSRHTFDVLILSTGSDVNPFLPAVAAMRRNERLKETPVVVLAPRKGLSDPQAAMSGGISDILYPPLDAAQQWHGEPDWLGRIRTFLTENVTRRALRDALRAFPPESFCDPTSGLPARGLFEAYLAQMQTDQRAFPRPWSLVVFSWGASASLGKVTEAADLRKQAALIISQKRPEYFCAQIGPSQIAMVLPDQAQNTALTTGTKIKDALAVSFGGKEPLPHMTVLAGMSEDSPRGIITRALQADQRLIAPAGSNSPDPASHKLGQI